MVAAVCPRCTAIVSLHEGRPFVSANGAIELWHRTCWDTRHARGVEEVTVIAPPPSSKKPIGIGVGAAVAFVAVAIASYSLRIELPPASLATIHFDTSETLRPSIQLTEREAAPPPFDPRDAYPVPVVDDMPLDEQYPSLLDWIHPVVDTETFLPEQSSGRFGAGRGGVDRSECGRGHCGVDLGGPIGRAIVSVADGVIVRVERSELGRDGKSGRYVRIEHADGSLTSYMHLDSIIDGLEVGDRVDGGQQIGTLGASAVHSAQPHCHFALELPKVPGTHGDNANTYYVDPAPFLVRASIARAPDRRHAQKPAF
jgi:murein DD-endopeptidase MepM/ murein hydrolase activator NlpD